MCFDYFCLYFPQFNIDGISAQRQHISRKIISQNSYFQLLIAKSVKFINKTWQYVMDARNYLLEIMSLHGIILHSRDLTTHTVSPCFTGWIMCFADKYLEESSPKKFIGESVTLAIYKTEFYGTIGNRKKPLTNVTRRSIIDVAGVLDKCLIKNLKMSKS